MALNGSGPISLGGPTVGQSVNLELGLSATATVSLNDTLVRTLFGKASGVISLADGYGKANRAALSVIYSTNTADATLNLSGISGYVAGKSDITVTVNSGIYIYSTNTANAGLTFTGGTTGDTLTLINNGYIMGMGGAGGYQNMTGRALTSTANGGNGGNALSLSINTTVNNTAGYIGGGGGGSGALVYVAAASKNDFSTGGQGGAGGGSSGANYDSGSTVSLASQAGGGVGAVGSVTNDSGYYACSGGRVIPASDTGGGSVAFSNNSALGGTVPAAAQGGGAGYRYSCTLNSYTAYGGGTVSWGLGGGIGVGGNAGITNYNPATWLSASAGWVIGATAGAGGWGASAGTGTFFTASSGGSYIEAQIGSAGVGGKSVSLNGKTVTWQGGFQSARTFGAIS